MKRPLLSDFDKDALWFAAAGVFFLALLPFLLLWNLWARLFDGFPEVLVQTKHTAYFRSDLSCWFCSPRPAKECRLNIPAVAAVLLFAILLSVAAGWWVAK